MRWISVLRGLLRLVGWLEKAPLARASLAAAALLLGAVALRGCLPASPLRVATFNIRRFGEEPTDMAHLKAMIEGLDAGIIAVQEIMSVARLDELARALQASGKPYRVALSRCAGRGEMRVGFLYDERRATLRSTREFRELLPDGEGGCNDGDRPGLLGVFEAGGEPLHALVVHLKAGDEPSSLERRRLQWGRVLQIVQGLQRDGARRVVVLGDTNSTGFLDNHNKERDLIDDVARQGKLSIATGQLACSEYYKKSPGQASPSLLDHILVSDGKFDPASVSVHAHCAELSCQPTPLSRMPASYHQVSDHCPITLSLPSRP